LASREAIGRVIAQERKEHKRELEDEVCWLRIELSNLETTLAELRSIIASEPATVIDMPSRRSAN
jgi:hypothetical protein